MERPKELSFSVRNSGDTGQPAGLAGSNPGFVGDLQLLSGEELEARLQVHDRIGGGSSARVYRGTLDSTLPVAVKVLHPHAAQRESTLQEFLREAQVLARLQNKYIIRLYALAHIPPNFGGLPTRRFTWGIVTEYMEAGTLTKLVQGAAKIHQQQQRIKAQMAAAAVPSLGGASSAAPERSTSLRTLRNNLSFLRCRSLTPGSDTTAAPPSPRNRGGVGGGGDPSSTAAVPPSPSAGGSGAGGCGASAARLDSLTHEIPPLPYTDREALQWCMELALALQFLHAQTPPVVHRDVKTDNVLMAPGASTAAAVGLRGGAATETGPVAAAAAGGPGGAQGASFTTGGCGLYGSHGNLARRVLSIRAAAAAAAAVGVEAVAPSRQCSVTAGMAVRSCGGRPLTAKLCDFGLHVVLHLSRPVVTVRRRSYEHSYGADALAMAAAGGGSIGPTLPYSNSLAQCSARHSPAGGAGGAAAATALSPTTSITAATAATAGAGPIGPPSPLAALHIGGMGMFCRAVSRDGDSFSRAQAIVHRKTSNLSHADSFEQNMQPILVAGRAVTAGTSGGGGGSVSGGSIMRGVAAAGAGVGVGIGIFSSSPPKPGPFAGSAAAAAAAAAAAFGSNAGGGGLSGISRLSSGAMGSMGTRGSGGGTDRSPKTSGPGSGPGPPKWSGGSAAAAIGQHSGLSNFGPSRASLDLLLQRRLSTTAAVAASQFGSSIHSMMIATSGGGGGGVSVPGIAGGGGGGCTASMLPTSVSHMTGVGGGIETLSTGQMMLQLNATSHTGMLDRVSRLRPSNAGPSTGDLGLGFGGGMTLEAALRIGNRSSSGRPSAATAAALLAAGVAIGVSGNGGVGGGSGGVGGGGVGGGMSRTETGMNHGGAGGGGGGGPSTGAVRAQRPSAGSPAASSRYGTRLRSNPTQVEKYLAMMEEDLQLDIASRASSKAQADMDPLYGAASRAGSQTAVANHSRSGGPGGGPGSAIHCTPSNRSLLLAGASQGSIPGIAHLAQLQHPHQGGPPATSTAADSSQPKPTPSAKSLLQPSHTANGNSTSHATTTSPATAAGVPSGGVAVVVATTVGLAAGGRLQESASGSGSGSAPVAGPVAVATEATGASGGARTSNIRPNSPSSPSARVCSTNSTRSEQAMIVLTGLSCSGYGDQATPAAGGSGGGGGATTAAALPAAAGGYAAAGLRGMAMLARGPNPMKASSQPVMSVSNSSNAGHYAHVCIASPGRGPNPMKSSSQPAMSVSIPTLTAGDPGRGVAAATVAAPPPPPSTRAALPPMMTTGQLHGTSGGGSSGAQSPPRGPNPFKSSSQPAISVNSIAAGAAGCAPSGRCRDASSSTLGGAATKGLMRTASHGSRVMSHLSSTAMAAVAASPVSPTCSVHAMDLSPPAGGIKSSRMGQPKVLQATGTAAAAAATAASTSGLADGDPPHPDSSGGVLMSRRNRQPLEVAVPGDSCGGVETASSTSGSALRARLLLPPGVSRGGSSAGGDGTGGGGGSGGSSAAAAVLSRQWVATVTAAASPRTHSPSGPGGGSGGRAGGGGGGGQLATAPSGGTDINILPMPPTFAHVHTAANVVLNRELHKVVKRLRPDGGGSSFTGSGNSPLGLPPTAPMHHGSGSGGSAAAAATTTAAAATAGEAGSFTYSRRSSMDSHPPSYNSIGSARSATAALQQLGVGGCATASGSGGLHGGGGSGGPTGLSTLHREKLVWGRGLLVGTNSAGHSSAGGPPAVVGVSGGSFAHSGPMLSGVLASDPNSPVSYGVVAVGSGSLLGRAPAGMLRHTPVGQGGSLMGQMASIGAASAAVSGPSVPRTTSGGVSASGANSGRQSSAGDRSARQSSLVQQSSSTLSWGDYGAPGGGAAAAATATAHVPSGAGSGGASPSRANTGASMRLLGNAGPSCGSVAAAAAAAVAAASAQTPSALASPMLAHVTGGGSQASSTTASMGPQRLVSESNPSSTFGGWNGRDETPPQGEAAYALTGRAGTLLYMAPEVIRHEPYNEKVDVFSFGVVLYEVFGRVLLLELYSKDELEALSSRISMGFRHSRPDCMPQAIWDLVQQCWAQNPADRPSMPLVVRQMELALEAMDEAEAAAAAATHSHRAGSLFGDGGPGLPSGSPMLTNGGTGPGSNATAGKDRSSGRSVASYKSLLSYGGSLGRRSKGLSFRRRNTHPRSPPQPTAPTPGRPPSVPSNPLGRPSTQSHHAGGGGGAAGGGQLGLHPRPLRTGNGLQSPLPRGSSTAATAAAASGSDGGGGGQAPDSPVVGGRFAELRCVPCGCTVC